MLNKKGRIADLVSLSVATIIIAMILIGVVVVSGIVKNVEGVNNGEKIYKDGEVGVGDLRFYMANYNNLVDVVRRVGGGEDVDGAVAAEGYSKAKEFSSSSYRGGLYG